MPWIAWWSGDDDGFRDDDFRRVFTSFAIIENYDTSCRHKKEAKIINISRHIQPTSYFHRSIVVCGKQMEIKAIYLLAYLVHVMSFEISVCDI